MGCIECYFCNNDGECSSLRKSEKFVHLLGFGCLFACVGLAFMVFLHIAFQGYFLGVESNRVVLALELATLPVSAAYFGYLWIQKMKEMKK